MKMREFIVKYCSDIVSIASQKKSLMDLDGFSYDAIIEDIDGTPIRIIYAGEEEIPIIDILSLERNDFIKLHPSFEAAAAYNNYIDSIIILEGEEALSHIRNEMLRERDRIENFKGFVDSI